MSLSISQPVNIEGDPEKDASGAVVHSPKGVPSPTKAATMNNNADKSFEPPNYKIEVVFSLLSMLNTQGQVESSNAFLRLSKETANCQLMIESGCISLIVQLLHPSQCSTDEPTSEDIQVFERAAQTLRNIVMSQADKAKRSRESKILRLLEKIRSYILHLRFVYAGMQSFSSTFLEKEVCPCVAMLMKSSFDEENRLTASLFGGLQAICETLILDQLVFGENAGAKHLLLRRYIGMALTNLTFGDVRNKQLLCRYANFLSTVNMQIQSGKDDLRQVYASVLRNLSWKADPASKTALRSAQAVPLLMKAAMETKKKPALKSILSALWNLTAHCSENQLAVCSVPSAIEFLVSTLKIHGATGSAAIIENCGGILRNISVQLAGCEEHRRTLRSCGYYQILLSHLQSSNLTVVSNACGTIWNLSAYNAHDQRYLRELGAVPLLKKLINSKHALIKLASASALNNLAYMPMTASPSNSKFGKTTVLSAACDFTEDSRLGTPVVAASASKTFLDGVCFRDSGNRADDLISNLSESFCSTSFDTSCLSTTFDRTGVSEAVFDQPPETQGSNVVYPSSRPPSDCKTTEAVIHAGDQRVESRDLIRTDSTQEALTSTSPLKHSDQSETPMMSTSELKAMENRVVMCEHDAEPFAGDQETLKRFAVEDTPSQVSLRSSFSSLHAAVVEQPPKREEPVDYREAKVVQGSNNGNGGIAPSIEPVEVKTSSNMTPMVFSRHSSLQSLNSCDQQSVHSTVYSEYSQFQTGQVSPSDLPDSPSQSMPMSSAAEKKTPSQQEPPHPLPLAVPSPGPGPEPESYQRAYERAETSFHNLALVDKSVTDYANELDDRPKVYRNEGSSVGGLSSASSLSALTVDPDTKIKPSHSTHSRIPVINGAGNVSMANDTKRRPADFVATENKASNECFGFRVPFIRSLGSARGDELFHSGSVRKEQPPNIVKSDELLSDQKRTNASANIGKDSAGNVRSSSEQREDSSSEVPDILTVIQLAMPKPRPSKSVHHKHSGKNCAGGSALSPLSSNSRPVVPPTKPPPPPFYSSMKCQDSDVKPLLSDLMCHCVPTTSGMSDNLLLLSGEEDVKVYTSESTPGFSLRSSWNDLRGEEKTQAPRVSEDASLQSPVGGIASDPSDFAKQRSELKECIYMAFPKPRPSRKSKSLDRKAPFTVASATNTTPLGGKQCKLLS